ncbi:MAG: HAD hydrolase-like protein, partial [Clostridia bacterium]|nr:HAD hydrolase-like protein [Clostridia bacterium]
MARRIKLNTLLKKYRVFIWDFDGTLYNTYPETVRAYGELLSEAGIPVPPEVLEEKARESFSALHAYLTAEYGLGRDFYLKCHARRRELEPLYSRPFPGAKEFCEKVTASGGENWLYTHRDESALPLLRQAGMEELFSDFLLATDGFPWKPAPDALNALVGRNGRAK